MSANYGDNTGSFSTSSGSAAAKAITVDSRGYIYTGRPDDPGAQIRVFDSTFTRLNSADVPMTAFGHDKTVNGMTVVTSGSDYFLYTTGSSSSSGWVNRWNVTDPAAPVLDSSFDSDGRIDLTTITGASSPTYLRGIDVTSDGTIFTASLDSGKVHRISSDLTAAISANVARAHDVAVYGDRVYVATYDGTNSRVHVLDALTLAAIEVLDPLAALGLSRGTSEGFSGVDIDSGGRIFVSDQVYASTGTCISDRVFVAVVPEPMAAGLMATTAGWCLMMRRRRA